MGRTIRTTVSRYRIMGAVLCGMGPLVVGTPLAAAPFDLTVRGGPARGLYELIGEGISNVLRQGLPDSRISYAPGSSAGNIVVVAEGKADVGVSNSIDMRIALRGGKPFKSKLEPGKVYALARLFDTNLLQIFIRADAADRYGISTLADIAKKKPPLNLSFSTPGNVSNQTLIRGLFAQYGFAPEDFKAWGGKVFLQNSGGTLNLMRDRKVDLFPIGLFAPDARFADLHRNLPLRLLPVGDKVADALADEFKLATHVIPADAYPFLDHAYQTVGMDAFLIVGDKVSNEAAYALTKALADGAKKMRAIHRAFGGFSPKEMAGVKVLPYHPGANRYYQEAGITPGK